MGADWLGDLLRLAPEARLDWYASLSKADAHAIARYWPLWARAEQMPPTDDWHTWLICAGRGFGKTRAGAEWVRMVARSDPEARIALVGASLGEVRSVMIEGESGILAVSSPDYAPRWEPSLRRLSWPGGARGYCYSAAEPEALRGPQHSHAWCDEIAKWDNAGERATAAWDNLQMGLRLGEVPIVSIDRLFGGESTFRLGPWTMEYLRWFLWGMEHLHRAPKAGSRGEVVVRLPMADGHGRQRPPR